MLSGDAVHLQETWSARRAPAFSYDAEQSFESMDKLCEVIAKTGAPLWINHDKTQSDGIPKAPAYVE